MSNNPARKLKRKNKAPTFGRLMEIVGILNARTIDLHNRLAIIEQALHSALKEQNGGFAKKGDIYIPEDK